MALPGFAASIITSPLTSSNLRSTTFASSGKISSNFCFADIIGFLTLGSALITILFLTFCASVRIKSLLSEKISTLGVYKTTLDASTFTSVKAMLSGMTSVATFFTNLITSSTAIFRPPGFYWSEFNLPN